MKDVLQVADYLVVSGILVAFAVVGLYFRFTGGKQKTTKEFLMAGKNMSVLPVTCSLMATFVSAITVLGIPAETYMYGTQYVMAAAGLIFGGLISAHLILPVFFELQVSSAYEYLEKRYGKTTRIIASVLFIIQMNLYMSVVLYAPSLALSAIAGFPTWASVIAIAFVCMFYCSLGGLKAVLWTDVLQSLLMFTMVISVVTKGIMTLRGFQNFLAVAEKGGRISMFNMSLNPTVRYTFWNSFLTGLLMGLTLLGTNQAQIQRLMSVSSLKKAKQALLMSVPMIMLMIILSTLAGLVVYGMFSTCDPILDSERTGVNSPDKLIPYTIVTMFQDTPGLVGFLISGIFSASLSSMSSALNSLAAVTIEDLIKPRKKLIDTNAAFLAKLIAMGYGCFCLLLTYGISRFRGVYEACNVVFMTIGGPVLGVFCLGMFTIKANEKGTLLGLGTGIVFNSWLAVGSYVSKIKIPALKTTIDGCQYNFLVGFPNVTTNMFDNTFQVQNDSTASEEDWTNISVYGFSYLWFPIFSTVMTIAVGYIASIFAGYFITRKDTDPLLLSPLFREWLKKKTDGTCQEMELLRGDKCNVLKEDFVT